MAGRGRERDWDDGDTFYTTGSGAPPSRRGRRGSEVEASYERIEDDGPGFRRSEVRYRSRSRDRSESRLPHFMREERRPSEGVMVVRGRPRSPSPVVRFQEERVVRRARSVSPLPPVPRPPPQRERVEVRERLVERDPPRGRSPSPHPNAEMIRTRRVSVSRGRGRSPSPEPPKRQEEMIRIIKRERSVERKPAPPPPQSPPVIRGPTIEREVITHYKDIDHGIVAVRRPPSPKRPPPRPALRTVDRETEIDITHTRDRTDVGVRRRSVSRERMSGALVVSPPSPRPARKKVYYIDDDDEELVVEDRLRVDIDERRRSASVSHERRRASSAAPPPKPRPYDDEAAEITSRIDSRGRIGEAYNGATRDWTIVDVPPGTERVRMEGAGGAAADVSWQRYSGVRRAKFIPERDSGALVVADNRSTANSSTTVSTDRVIDIRRERSRERKPKDVDTRERINVQVVDKSHDIEIEKTSRGRPSRPRRVDDDMWTEITKDLVCREAIEDFGYEYEETEHFFYIMEYLRYEDVLEMVQLTDEIRRRRRRHVRELEWDHRESGDGWERRSRRRRSRGGDYDEEVIVDHEVVIDRPPVRGYR